MTLRWLEGPDSPCPRADSRAPKPFPGLRSFLEDAAMQTRLGPAVAAFAKWSFWVSGALESSFRGMQTCAFVSLPELSLICFCCRADKGPFSVPKWVQAPAELSNSPQPPRLSLKKSTLWQSTPTALSALMHSFGVTHNPQTSLLPTAPLSAACGCMAHSLCPGRGALNMHPRVPHCLVPPDTGEGSTVTRAVSSSPYTTAASAARITKQAQWGSAAQRESRPPPAKVISLESSGLNTPDAPWIHAGNASLCSQHVLPM